jgi:cholinesterase
MGEPATGFCKQSFTGMRYHYFGDFPNLKLSIELDSGAWHGGDISVIFDTDNDIQHTDDRMFEDERFGRYWRGAWATFARDPEKGLVK